MNRLLIISKQALLAIALLATLFIVGCDDGDDGDPEPQVFDGTILDLINDDAYKQATTGSADNSFDSLVKYLSEHQELTAKLDGSSEYTFFAPSNKAFINLLATPNFPQDIRLISPDVIMNVLSYHIVEGVHMQADLTSGTQLDSEFTDPLSPAAPQKITVNSNGTLMAAPNATNIDIDIVEADIRAQNGVVHIVESVMIPPSTGAVLVPILGKVAGTVLLGKDFTNLAKVIMAADAGYTENPSALDFKVTTWLAMPISAEGAVTANQQGITFFAPPNDVLGTPVLTEAAANALISMDDHGRAWLMNHLVVSGQYTVADAPSPNPANIMKFTNGQMIEPMSGKDIMVVLGNQSAQNPYGIVLSNNPADQTTFRPIVAPDLAHSNGTLHVYAGSLQ